MKKTLVLLSFLFSIQTIVFSQDISADIAVIRTQFAEIQNNRTSYQVKNVEFMDASPEGGKATGYFDGADIKLIELTLFGETRKYTITYYITEKHLFFVLQTLYLYNRPISWTEDIALENGDTEYFELSKSVIIEQRYYFKHDILIRWLDNNKEEVNLDANQDFEIDVLGLLDTALEKF